MASGRIKTGIKKDASYDQNLKAVREACSRYGVETVIDRLQEMKALFYWVRDPPDQKEMIDNRVYQIEFNHYVAPFLTEEVEINEIISEGGAFKSRKRKIKVLIDPLKGEPGNLGGLLY